MTIPAAAIRTAISEVLEGDLGTLRVPSDTFERGAFEGQPDAAKLALLRQTSTATHWFDVVLGEESTHGITSLSTRSTRVVQVPVTIEVWTGLATEPQEDDRSALLSAIGDDLEDAARALAYWNSITATVASVSTAIVGGCMRGTDNAGAPDWTIEDENWQGRYVHSRIVGAVVVRGS
ncbi:MAG TPA: hypothetical protein VHM19_14045 [Polyangiales bacterium]|nr:hypothetical protein [Polyangiales bacterium]